MLMAYLTLITGLLISIVAIFYSVAGLASIFSAAVIPIIIMGAILEVAKLVATVWLKQNWTEAPRFLKGYLLGAVAILMFITSMGIFGFLSKAHSDQTLVSGDVQAKISIYDEKIKTAKDNIDANRKALKQMDEAVDQVMGRSSDEKGADKAVGLRRSQQKERARLQSEIAAEQKTISALNDEAAPIRAEVRKVEAEVGPIKYIAAFIYGDNPDANLLERAVTWVIILIVVVFDPLAVMLLLASQYTFAWMKRPKEEIPNQEQEQFDLPIDSNSMYGSSGDVSIDGDRPIPSFLLKKETDQDINLVDEAPYQPGYEDVAIKDNAGMDAEDKKPVVEYKILEDVDDEEFIVITPHETGTDNPIDFPNVSIRHTPDSIIIADGAGTKEISTVTEVPDKDLSFRELVDKYGYSGDHDGFKVNGVDYTVEEFERLMKDEGYVQNEEQSESGVWSKIVNKTITEDQYLNESQKRQSKKDV
jgi:hypothetical protein